MKGTKTPIMGTVARAGRDLSPAFSDIPEVVEMINRGELDPKAFKLHTHGFLRMRPLTLKFAPLESRNGPIWQYNSIRVQLVKEIIHNIGPDFIETMLGPSRIFLDERCLDEMMKFYRYVPAHWWDYGRSIVFIGSKHVRGREVTYPALYLDSDTNIMRKVYVNMKRLSVGEVSAVFPYIGGSFFAGEMPKVKVTDTYKPPEFGGRGGGD